MKHGSPGLNRHGAPGNYDTSSRDLGEFDPLTGRRPIEKDRPTWTLRGFDRRTEFVGHEIGIPETILPVIRGIVPPREDDPRYVDPHEATADQTERLAAALGAKVDTDRFDYFVESEADWPSIAKKIAAMRASV